jgi:hypothetical protein
VRRWWIGLLVLTMAITSASRIAAQQPVDGTHLRLSLLTMGPGEQIWERFGHNAIWVEDTVAHTSLIYNYGTFLFPAPGAPLSESLKFYWNFARGYSRYWLGVDRHIETEIEEYQFVRRDLDVQELNLTPMQRADLATRLAVNAQEANRYYFYDYFRDNCSTRVRDMLDATLGGALKRATSGHMTATTYRFHTLRSITNDKLMYLGINTSFGPRVDRPIDEWQEMFLPQKVQQHVATMTVTAADGSVQPLVLRTARLVDARTFHVDAAPPPWRLPMFLIGIALALVVLLALLHGPAGVMGRVVATLWLVLAGVASLLLLFFWTFTQHVATWANHNLLVLSPLAFLVIPGIWTRRDAQPGRWRLLAAKALLISGTIGALVALLPVLARQDSGVFWLAWPPTMAAALIAVRNRWRRT